MGPRIEDIARADAERALVPEPPNLKNTALARNRRRQVSVDLEELDGSNDPSRNG
jgi:hypothetical protein